MLNSPNPVEGDVQALIAECKARIRAVNELERIGIPLLNDHIEDRSIAKTALAALTAQPSYEMYTVNGWMKVSKEYYDGVDRSRNVFREIYTTPPAQLLRPVELPEPYDDGHGNLWLPQDAVIYAVKNAGGEVKS